MALADTTGRPLPSGERTVADAEADSPGLLHDSDLPRASETTSPVVRAILAALAAAFAIASIWGAVAGMIASGAADAENDFAASVVALVGGAAFLFAAVFIWRDRLVPTLIAAVVGAACGIVSTFVM